QLSAKSLLEFARRALRHNLHKEFHATMAELTKELDRAPNDEAAKEYGPIVKNYQRVQQELKNKPAGDDPAFKALRAELVAEKFNERISDGGHYALWYSSGFKPGPDNEALLKQKLARLEEHLESFYYWFALVDRDAEQPAM